MRIMPSDEAVQRIEDMNMDRWIGLSSGERAEILFRAAYALDLKDAQDLLERILWFVHVNNLENAAAVRLNFLNRRFGRAVRVYGITLFDLLAPCIAPGILKSRLIDGKTLLCTGAYWSDFNRELESQIDSLPPNEQASEREIALKGFYDRAE